MSVRTRNSALGAVLLAGALTLGAVPAAVGAPTPTSSTATTIAAGSKTPKVLTGIRKGPRKIHCPGGNVVGLFIDYAPGAFDSSSARRTPAKAVRHYVRGGGTEHEVVRYERRALRKGPGEPPNQALFVGLRKDGTVTAQVSVERAGKKKHWLVGQVQRCAG